MNDNIFTLFQKYFSNTASAIEKKELNDWIASNPEIQEWIENEIGSSVYEMSEEQQQKLLDNIHRIIDDQHKRRFILPPWIKSVAAAILILITVGSLYYAIQSNKPEAIHYTEIEAIRGQKSKITLPDGTRVTLNSESKIKYGTDFNKINRTLALNGEAYFNVASDKNHPFTVKTGDISITAVGTSFNVRAYSNEHYISTTLAEGKVTVKTPFETMDMKPNERVEYDNKNQKAALIKLDDIKKSVGWINDQLSFENATLAEVASNLSHIYNVVIEFSSESMKEQRFTGKINNNSLQSVLRILSLTSPIRYKIQGNKVILYEVKDEGRVLKTP